MSDLIVSGPCAIRRLFLRGGAIAFSLSAFALIDAGGVYAQSIAAHESEEANDLGKQLIAVAKALRASQGEPASDTVKMANDAAIAQAVIDTINTYIRTHANDPYVVSIARKAVAYAASVTSTQNDAARIWATNRREGAEQRSPTGYIPAKTEAEIAANVLHNTNISESNAKSGAAISDVFYYLEENLNITYKGAYDTYAAKQDSIKTEKEARAQQRAIEQDSLVRKLQSVAANAEAEALLAGKSPDETQADVEKAMTDFLTTKVLDGNYNSEMVAQALAKVQKLAGAQGNSVVQDASASISSKLRYMAAGEPVPGSVGTPDGYGAAYNPFSAFNNTSGGGSGYRS